MRKVFVLFVVLALAACGAPAPAATEQAVAALPEPSQTPVVIVQTVVVEATQVPAQPAPVEPVVVTVVVEPTQAPAVAAPTEAPATTDGSAPIALDNVLGAGVFINMTMSGNAFTLRCFPRDVTFNITANDAAIEDAVLFYRIVDKPDALYPSAWQGPVPMVDNGGGNFSIVFSGENVNENLRLDEAWFDFQFVGLNKGGGVVDRTQKIERLITFAKDCE